MMELTFLNSRDLFFFILWTKDDEPPSNIMTFKDSRRNCNLSSSNFVINLFKITNHYNFTMSPRASTRKLRMPITPAWWSGVCWRPSDSTVSPKKSWSNKHIYGVTNCGSSVPPGSNAQSTAAAQESTRLRAKYKWRE